MKKSLLFLALLLAPQIAFAGSASFTTPGIHSFQVPNSNALTVTVKGAGGGGGAGGNCYPWGGMSWASWSGGWGAAGNAGSASSFNGSLVGYGGGGGAPNGNMATYVIYGGPGANGGAAGGDSNSAGAGSSGGAGGTNNCPGIQAYVSSLPPGGRGGNGGLAVKTYPSGTFAVGSSITVVIGTGGAGGYDSTTGYWGGYIGGTGAAGSVTVTWADTPPPPPPLPPPPPTVANKPAYPINVGQNGSAAGTGQGGKMTAGAASSLAFDRTAYCEAPDKNGRPRSADWIRNCLANLIR